MIEAEPRKRTAGATPLSSCRLCKVIRKIPFAPAFQSSEIETALSKIRTHHVMKKTMATLILVFLLPPAGFDILLFQTVVPEAEWNCGAI